MDRSDFTFWDKFIEFFAKRHMLANFMFIGIMVAGIFFWFTTNKEEMPNITRDFVAISASYPGASAEQVEYFVTKELEDAIKGIDGVYRVTSTSSSGSASLRVELELKRPDRDEIISEIKSAVSDAKLPDEVTDDPRVREFKSSKMAIIDIGLHSTDDALLTDEKRRKLHEYAIALENQLLNLPQVSEVNRQAYRNPEIRIEANPDKLKKYNISLNTVGSEIRSQNSRQPIGYLEDKLESKVTLDSELDTVAELEDVIIQGGFEGQKVRVKDIATVTENFEKSKFIQKINGHEGIFLNVVKTANSDILNSVDAVKKVAENFSKHQLKDTGFGISVLDDESRGLRNRLYIILTNGAIGLILVIAILLTFLNLRTAFWVALGIPFTFAATMVGINMLGYTINNITLGAIIIVMGMIVDDAIIVAENISRFRSEGMEFERASIKGTSYVFLPVVAAIITTCLSFSPLFANIGGWHGVMISFLPPVIFLMLGASLFESVLILPGHMSIHFPSWLTAAFNKIKPVKKKISDTDEPEERTRHWFLNVEEKYGRLLDKLLKKKYWVILVSILLIVTTFMLAGKFMKFTMFPRNESEMVSISGTAPRGSLAADTSALVQPVEDILNEYLGKEVVGVRTEIARSRRGRAVMENAFRIRIQVVPREKRKISLNNLIKVWQKKMEPYEKNFEKIEFSKSWWGGGSDSPIVVQIRDNNDANRKAFAADLAAEMKKHSELKNVEIDRPITNPEYKIDLKRDRIKQLGISGSDVRSTLRSAVEGSLLYEIKGDDEEMYVRLTLPEKSKKNIDDILDTPVENRGNYLVPLKNVVTVTKQDTPASIEREEYMRTLNVFSDMKQGTKTTPLEIAQYLEENVFPALLIKYPSTAVAFEGEIKDSREASKDLVHAVVLAFLMIYAILTLLFSSPLKPFIILVTIPFGVVGIILALFAHGMLVYGFFTLLGGLGLMGVVVNDSIVMLTKLDREYDKCGHKDMSDSHIASIAKTRLQAVLLTTLTTVAALFPTAYGVAGYDAMLSEMMLVMAWGLLFGTMITLILVPCLYGFSRDMKHFFKDKFKSLNNAADGDCK